MADANGALSSLDDFIAHSTEMLFVAGGDGALDELTELRARDRMLRALINALPIAMWAVDTDGTYLYHEGKGLEAAGHQPGQLVGANIFDLYGEARGAVRRALAGDPVHGLAEVHGCVWESWMVPLAEEEGRRPPATSPDTTAEDEAPGSSAGAGAAPWATELRTAGRRRSRCAAAVPRACASSGS
ncbi:PAS domain-containing protein [Sorangium sp. So ce145]|uniref:PAS domain-containing protein n=1 Tax=Sorangium sp. So ce145 TaxID=3133285 RepID=UPI003F624080